MAIQIKSPDRLPMIEWRWLATVLRTLVMFSAALTADPAGLAADATTSVAPLLRVSGPIGPATADYIERGLQKAARDRAQLVILQIDTPGGLDSSTRQIIKAILASSVPVVAWVAPSGARAASAGAYMVYASHIAAMAPGTNLGAATPVQIGGVPSVPRSPAPASPTPQDLPDGKAKEPAGDTGEVRPAAEAMTRKIVNDSAAYLRSLAQLRGRNVEWADQAVRDGVSLSAVEARTQGVIDYIAADLQSLLQQAHGHTMQMNDGTQRALDSRGISVVPVESDWRTQLLSVITDPTVAYLLLLLGIYGIYFEVTSPGFGVPGVAGMISLLLGMFALQMLPVSYAGAALIVLGFALLVAEAFIPSFGALGIGGVIAFVIGSIMLIDTDTPGFGIPIGLIGTVAVTNVLFVVVVFRLALKARDRPVVSGSEELTGAAGEVLEVGHGLWVRVHGERWRAASTSPLNLAQRVRVVGRDGLVLQVEPQVDQPASESTVSGKSS